MDFTRKYGTRFWTLLDEMAEAAELANELTEYETTIGYPRNIETQNSKNEGLLKLGVAVSCPEKEKYFRELVSGACHVAEQCAIDIAIKGVRGKRGSIELKNDAIMLFSPTHRAILAELIQSADDVCIEAVDGEVRMKFLYNLFAVEYDR